ncbi:MAG: tetratricopeptide repeat protein [Phycisphaerae bacterium]|nr:tetratricopeptide repeat protein [Phycisphaerae bacterium]
MRILIIAAILAVLGLVAGGHIVFLHWQIRRIEAVLADSAIAAALPAIIVERPADNTLLPSDIAPIVFEGKDSSSADGWHIRIDFAEGEPIRCESGKSQWIPGEALWETIKARSTAAPATVHIIGTDHFKAYSLASIRIRTSADPVGAPIFYREVNLPFQDAVKDPSRIRWRFGSVASRQSPPIVLQNMPVCGNCHSFSADGSVLGMDVDYANNKASYVLTTTAPEMTLATSDIITWSDYRRQDNLQSFGLLSQVSPDGRYAISTVQDRSVFVPQDNLAYSQLFFPIKGILVYYDRQTKEYKSLPGADDPRLVQSNPVWSPDGKWIYFARATAYELKAKLGQGTVLLSQEECLEFVRDRKEFRFDIYRVPFNEGRGGTPEPLAGASANGKSNYFPRFSPDGKWIVFCQANSYMLLQPDSELFLVPADGGAPKRLECNGPAMNSWHSWSPNGKWLVFSSKSNTPYTQLFLTHIDNQGLASPAVLLDWFTAADRAANIPEFVNLPAGAIRTIREQFLNDYSFQRAGNEFYRQGDADGAIEMYRKTLQLNPKNAGAHTSIGFLLYHVKNLQAEGLSHLQAAVTLDPTNGCARYDLGYMLLHQNRPAEAVEHLAEAVRVFPDGYNKQYNAVDMNATLGMAYSRLGQYAQAAQALARAAGFAPENAKIRYNLAIALAYEGKTPEAIEHYQKAVTVDPAVDRSPAFHDRIGRNLAASGQWEQAIQWARRGMQLALTQGDQDSAGSIEERIRIYERRGPLVEEK